MVEKQDFEAMIVRFLEGTASPDEAMLLEDWKNESQENQEMYDQYERLFAQNQFQKVDVDAAWKKVHADINKETKVIPMRNWRNWAVAAAAIAVLALIIPGLFEDQTVVKLIDTTQAKTITPDAPNNVLHATNGVQSFNLEDKSVVALEKGSTLELAEDFLVGERRATLKGSGRFTVVHDEEHPFIIDVEGLEVYDIGTVFDISTSNDTVKVVVLEGAVELRKNGQVLAMEEGDSAFYLISDKLIKEYPTREALDGITQIFEGATLQQVVDHLSKFFKVEIVIVDEAIKEKEISIGFDDRELPEVLTILELILDVKVKRVNDKIEIYEKE